MQLMTKATACVAIVAIAAFFFFAPVVSYAFNSQDAYGYGLGVQGTATASPSYALFHCGWVENDQYDIYFGSLSSGMIYHSGNPGWVCNGSSTPTVGPPPVTVETSSAT